MEDEEDESAVSARRKDTIRKSGKGLQDLLSDMITKEDRQLERLTGIIHMYRVKGARSKEIACAIIKFVKEG